MILEFETYYYSGPGRETVWPRFREVITVTATSLAPQASFIEARLIVPATKLAENERKKALELTGSASHKQAQVCSVVDWLFSNSLPGVSDIFSLFLRKPRSPIDEPALFDHHDDTCCWALNVTHTQFDVLKRAFRRQDLPEDLFYLSDAKICTIKPTKHAIGKFFFPTHQVCLSPKMWEYEQSLEAQSK